MSTEYAEPGLDRLPTEGGRGPFGAVESPNAPGTTPDVPAAPPIPPGMRPPRCIRCGHDLRDLTLRWTESCPLVDRCAECGLEFTWFETLVPRAYWPKWSIERRGRRLAWPLRWLLTHVVVLFAPWHAARMLVMAHEFRWRRLVAGLLVWAGLLYLGAAATRWNDWRVQYEAMTRMTRPATAADRFQWGLIAGGLRFWSDDPVEVRMPLGASGEWVETARGWHDAPVQWIASTFDRPADFTLMKDESFGTFVVIPMESATSSPLIARPRSRPESDLAARWWELLANQIPPPPASAEQVQATRDRIVAQIERADQVVYEWPMLVRQRPPMIRGYDVEDGRLETASILSTRTQLAIPIWRDIPIFNGHFETYVVFVSYVLLTVVAFACLPIARRRARVRWAHLIRMACYLLLAALAAATAVEFGVRWDNLSRGTIALSGSPWLSVFGPPGIDSPRIIVLSTVYVGLLVAAGIVAWTSIAALHLRMVRPAAVGVSVSVIGGIPMIGGLATYVMWVAATT